MLYNKYISNNFFFHKADKKNRIYMEPYLGPKISYNLRKKGINVVTDAVPFQKVHFCTLFGVHISAFNSDSFVNFF